jgi:hypothetical protein
MFNDGLTPTEITELFNEPAIELPELYATGFAIR